MDTIVLNDSITGRMTDDDFLRFCLENKELRIERNSNLKIMIMSPVNTSSSYSSGAVFGQLYTWNIQSNRGIVFDSSVGFTLPDRSVLSPDASWLSFDKWSKLSEDDKNKFAPICPEFVIEVRSKSDSLSELQLKMKNWIKNGAELAWLIDPRDEVSFIYSANHPEEKIEGLDRKLYGKGSVASFELDLSKIKI